MKRRQFLTNSVCTVGAMVPVASWAQAVPCPPSTLSVDGGSSTSTPCSPPSSGSGGARGDIFTFDYASDRGNFDTETGLEREGRAMSQRRVAGGGPGGRDAFELQQLVNSEGEFYWGHSKQLSSFANGVSRFYRWRMFHNGSNNYRASPGRTINKLLIIGSGGGGGSRLILNANGYPNAGFALEMIFDGWNSAPPETAQLSKNAWHSVQMEARWGSGAYINLWVNSDNYSRPTLRLAGGTFNHTSSPGYTHFGAYSNNGLASGGVHTWRHADFRVASAFDSGWHGSV